MIHTTRTALFLGSLLLTALGLASGAAAMPVEQLEIETASGVRAFVVEVAKTPEEQGRGLMYRREMAPNAGMLFVYPSGGRVTMWMKNTYIPLDMVFIGADGRITHIVERTVPLSNELIRFALGTDGFNERRRVGSVWGPV